MPSALSYPGVYIEEVPSGVRTITGVPTSITAFLGRADRGPVDEPTIINGFGDYERMFGGLSANSPMSYAVKDFFQNGGGQAIIVRVYKTPDNPEGPVIAEIQVNDDLTLQAANEGVWGGRLMARIVTAGIPEDVALRYRIDKDALFNLEIAVRGETIIARDGSKKEMDPVVVEILNNLTVIESPRRLDRVLLTESSLLRVPLKDGRPALPEKVKASEGWVKAKGGADSAQPDPATLLGTSDPLNKPKSGLRALEKADLFNILCIPPDPMDSTVDVSIYDEAASYCYRRRAMLIVDSPASWSANKNTAANKAKSEMASGLGPSGPFARNAAAYFPRVMQADPLRDNKAFAFSPCGIVAGIWARTDTERGVWKAPAGLDAALSGVRELAVNLNDLENGMLNPLGLNCLRSFPVNGRVVWGARTLRGADQLADEYKYVPVRRTALFIEESLYRGTQWAVFEPNDEPLWAQLRLNIGAFMHGLFRQGAFQGAQAKDAYFVKCDKETTTQNDINLGIVNIVVGFAPLKPAEFVVIKLQQMAGQIQT